MFGKLFDFGGAPKFVFDGDFFLHFVFSPQPALIKGLWLTICAAVVSQIFGVVLGGILALCGMSKRMPLRMFNRAFLFFFRGTPLIVQLVLVYFGLPYLMGGFDLFPSYVPLGPISIPGALIAGIVTFSLHEAAYMSEIIRAGIQSIDSGQSEAAAALGMSPSLAMRRIILPQAFRVIVPPLGNQFNQMLKSTSLLSVIAVPELFRVSEEIQSATYKSFEVYLGVSVYYLLLTAIWTVIQVRLEKGLVRARKDTPKPVPLPLGEA